MPDSFTEPLHHPLIHSRSLSHSQTLPSITVHTEPQPKHDQPESSEEKGIGLIELSSRDRATSNQQHPTESIASGDKTESELDDGIFDADGLQPPNESSERQMRRSTRKGKDTRSPSKPDLTVETGQNGHLNGNANGHANGSMNSHIEMRRKHASEDMNSHTARAQLMSRADFTLDNDPVPAAPQTPSMVNTSFSNLPPQDKRNFLLLCVLYFLQGIPMGLASGSVPFLLKDYLSYGQIGIFSLAMYPYSLKLLWSPIVDAIWSRRFGRRKSWIVPIQAVSGLSMIYLGWQIDDLMKAAGADGGAGAWSFTAWWFLLVFLCATQDIAVDGWAVSLLSIQNISYASTAQAVGLTAGSFLSHTIFLALNAADFANRWFRTVPKDYGLVTLGGYMEFAGWAYIIVTIGLAVLKQESKTKERDGIMEVYRSMWGVLKLKNVITIMIIHLIAKLGFVTNDAVTNLKLLDKGFGQANMALVVLIDFPFEISLGYYAGKWSTEYTPLRLWCWAFVARLAAAVFAQITIMIYPSNPVPLWYMLVVIAAHIYSTFMNTVMFVAVSAFHARIADPVIGGTYMTLLATVSNLGGTFPKFFVLKLVDAFTVATCTPLTDVSDFRSKHPDVTPVTSPFGCALEAEKHRCIDGGGICSIERDGYYITNVVFVVIGAVLFRGYIQRKALALQALPLRAWRVTGQTVHAYTRVNTS